MEEAYVLKILYQSPNYRPERVERKYLHIDLRAGCPVVCETGGPHNYILRSYELPTEDFPRYSQAIADAEKCKWLFPYDVDLQEDPV